MWEGLDQDINKAAQKAGSARSAAVRKALTLDLAAIEQKKPSLKLGFAKPNQILATEGDGL